jgi:hypothetical protein
MDMIVTVPASLHHAATLLADPEQAINACGFAQMLDALWEPDHLFISTSRRLQVRAVSEVVSRLRDAKRCAIFAVA